MKAWKTARSAVEKRALLAEAFDACHGNRRAMAAMLGIRRETVSRILNGHTRSVEGVLPAASVTTHHAPEGVRNVRAGRGGGGVRVTRSSHWRNARGDPSFDPTEPMDPREPTDATDHADPTGQRRLTKLWLADKHYNVLTMEAARRKTERKPGASMWAVLFEALEFYLAHKGGA